MKKLFYSFLFLSFFSFILISFNCHKEVAKENDKPKLEKPDTIPPSHAYITGEITGVAPVQKDANGPCSEYPCIAKVKVNSIEYGSAFPVISTGKDVEIKFAFTLNKTTNEMFPNMDESYPGLKVGDKFEALVGHMDTAGDAIPFTIYGYKIIN